MTTLVIHRYNKAVDLGVFISELFVLCGKNQRTESVTN